MDWSPYYPAFVTPTPSTQDKNDGAINMTTSSSSPPPSQQQQDVPLPQPLTKPITVADIGCGFGGLLFALAPQMPDALVLGLEIRTSVTEYVQEKIQALRTQHAPLTTSSSSSPSSSPSSSHPYQNVSCIRANTMKFLPNFFTRAQLDKIFLCFPDPHFKARKHKARIVSATLTAEYAYVLRPGAKLYTVTDVEDLHRWMADHLAAHPAFARVGDAENAADPCVAAMLRETEEGKKVERNAGEKFVAVFRRLDDPPWP
jgi:tRNA (guanine-N7-)-methyltransferase